MKEIVLSSKDFSRIKELANKNWVNNTMRDDNFVCQCYINAFINYLNGNNMMVVDGKIYAKETTEKKL